MGDLLLDFRDVNLEGRGVIGFCSAGISCEL